MATLRVGGTPLFRTLSGPLALPLPAPACLAAYSLVAYQRGCPSALQWAKSNQAQLKHARQVMFCLQNEVLYGVD
jgi:hypothetical protein